MDIKNNRKTWEFVNKEYFSPVETNPFIIYKYDKIDKTTTRLKTDVNLDKFTLYNLQFLENKLFFTTKNDISSGYMKISGEDGSIEEIKIGKLELNEALEFYNASTSCYTSDAVVQIELKKPSIFELQDTKKAKDAMGKLVFKKYSFNGEKIEKEIDLSSKIKDMARKYGAKNKINKNQLLKGFAVTDIISSDNKFIVLLERFTSEKHYSYRKKFNETETTITEVQYVGEFISILLDNTGNVISQEITDRYGRSEIKNLYSFKKNSQIQILYFGKKRYSNVAEGLHSLILNNNGTIKEDKNTLSFADEIIADLDRT